MEMMLPDSLTSDLFNLWDKHGDTFMKNYWLMGNPFSMITMILSIFATIFLVGPYLSKSVKSRDLRPIMLITNGCVFGIIGMGWMMGFFLTRWGTDCFKCDGSLPQDSDLRTASLKMIAFMYVMTKLLEFQRPIFASLRGSSASDHYKNTTYLLFLFGQLFMSYVGGVFYPGGPLVFWPMLDAAVMIASYGYLVLRLASPELHPSPFWVNVVFALRFVTSVAILIHSHVFSRACNELSSTMSYLLNISFYYNGVVVAYQIASFLLTNGRNQVTKQHKPVITKSKITDTDNNNKGTAIQGH